MARILIVDDDESLRMLYEKEFTDDGYEVGLAESGEEALAKLDDGDYDVVILDLKMEGMDGLETLRRMLETKKDLKVVINTAYVSYKDDFSSWSADAYVLKSSDLTELKDTVKKLVS